VDPDEVMAREEGSAPHGIRNRVLAVFAVSLLFFVAVLVYGIAQLRAIGDSLVVVGVGYQPLSGVAANLQAVVGSNDRGFDRFAPSGPRPLEGYRESAKLYETSIRDGLAEARSILDTAAKSTASADELAAIARMEQQVDTIDAAAARYREGFDAWLAVNETPPADPAQATAVRAEMDRRRGELRNEISELGGLVDGRIQAVFGQTLRAHSRALVMSVALAVGAIFMSGVLAAVTFVTLRPIGLLTDQVQRLAKGDYTGRVDVSGSDEVGVLGREFNAMAEAVSERDRRLHDRAEALDRLSNRLRQVIDSIRAGLLVVEGGRVATLNPAAAALWGIGEGDPVPEWLDELSLGRHEAVSANGRQFDVAVVPFGDGGELIVGDDVTDRLRDRERLARSERLALVGQMLAQITHEVRNPLNAISLNAELLAEEVEDGESSAMLSVLTSEIRRLEGVTARYLDLARRRQSEPTSEDPLELVREGAQLEREALRRASVELTVSGTSKGVGELDGEALRRVLRNVLRNAVEAGAHEIHVAVEPHPDAVVVSVTDDGPGMDADQVARIFEPFYTTKAKGTGLGLAISRQELEDIGGTLVCESAPGRGSTFRVTLPVAWHGSVETAAEA
jgi:signal transduction histidine kinase